MTTTQDRIQGCNEPVCRPHIRHEQCRSCKQPTCQRALALCEHTLRRRIVRRCTPCEIEEIRRGFVEEQVRLRSLRTQKDWVEVTDPLDESVVDLDAMPEQYSSLARMALRVFLASDATRAVVPDSNASVLAGSIVALGLESEVYAETQDGQAVLRRIGDVK